MGLMGRYIDALNDEGRDNLLRATDWITNALLDGQGGGCLRGHAEGLSRMDIATLADMHEAASRGRGEARRLGWNLHAYDLSSAMLRAGEKFPAQYNKAVARFGKERVVRAIKLRAGASLEDVAALTPEREAVEV